MDNPMSHHSSDHTSHSQGSQPHGEGTTRRDFMVLTGAALGAVGAGAALVPFVDSMNPSADVLALASKEVDISAVQPGQTIKVTWRGVPVFIRRRMAEEIAALRAIPLSDLKDPQKDEDRVLQGHDEWLVMVGVCTHLGCIPIADAGEYNGFLCPCHGSHYDASGRIRKGPAPTNLEIPQYSFLSDTKIKIG
jgi:ubiquinol-cytochrome c reductase iron-sulfur subunit